MANLEARAAKARKMNAHHSTTDPQVSCLPDLLMSYAILLILTIMGACRHMALDYLLRGTLVTSHLA